MEKLDSGYRWGIFLTLSLVAIAEVRAAAASLVPVSENRDAIQVAQLAGQCRAAKKPIFVYRDRSPNNPLESLAMNATVALAEEDKNNGWIAITVLDSGTTGFVQTSDLRSCSEAPSQFPTPRPPTPPPFPPTTLPSNAVPPRSPRRNARGLCYQIIYRGPEGMKVRSGPSLNAARLGGLFFGDRVFIDPAFTRLDGRRRQWVKLTSPIEGWMSNGFPDFPSDRNLERCS